MHKRFPPPAPHPAAVTSMTPTCVDHIDEIAMLKERVKFLEHALFISQSKLKDALYKLAMQSDAWKEMSSYVQTTFPTVSNNNNNNNDHNNSNNNNGNNTNSNPLNSILKSPAGLPASSTKKKVEFTSDSDAAIQKPQRPYSARPLSATHRQNAASEKQRPQSARAVIQKSNHNVAAPEAELPSGFVLKTAGAITARAPGTRITTITTPQPAFVIPGGTGVGGDPKRINVRNNSDDNNNNTGDSMIRKTWGTSSNAQFRVECPTDETTAPKRLIEATLRQWEAALYEEDYTFDSLGLFLEVKWQEILNVTSKQSMPSFFRVACCCALLDRSVSVLGKYTPLIQSLVGELYRGIYQDYDQKIKDTLRPQYEKCTPYFVIMKMLQGDQEHMHGLQERMRIIQNQRESMRNFFNNYVEIQLIKSRNRAFVHWNAYRLRQRAFEKAVVTRYHHAKDIRCMMVHFRMFQQGVKKQKQDRDKQREQLAESLGKMTQGDVLSAHAAWARLVAMIAADVPISFSILRKKSMCKSHAMQTVAFFENGDTAVDASVYSPVSSSFNGTPYRYRSQPNTEEYSSFAVEDLQALGDQVDTLVKATSSKILSLTADPEVRTDTILRVGDEMEGVRSKISAFESLLQEHEKSMYT